MQSIFSSEFFPHLQFTTAISQIKRGSTTRSH